MGGFSSREVIWTPSQQRIDNSTMTSYMNWLQETKGLTFSKYTDLWKWSVDELEEFWESIWDYCGVKAESNFQNVLSDRKMPGATWFEGARLNYAENIFTKYQEDKTAIYFRSEHIRSKELSWKELEEKVASVAHQLRQLGVKRGDRVAAYMPNIPETVIAFLATASIGAIWSSCSPDFGTNSVVDRFKQIEPVVLFAIDGYYYNGKVYDKRSVVNELQEELDSLQHTIVVPNMNENSQVSTGDKTIPWEQISKENVPLTFEHVPFDHPLWILYSSGTTGMPKPIVQGHGGVLVEALKSTIIQQDLYSDDKVFWFTTTGWVMWNLLVSSLVAGSSIVLYDGNPTYPSADTLWEFAEDIGMTFFGTSAPFIHNSLKLGIKPNEKYDLSKLKALYSTGAPLSEDGFKWVYESVKEDIWLASISGGTDVFAAFVGGVGTEPVVVGEIQGRGLGVHVEAFDEQGNALVNEVGEMVITKPMPSMPLYFWGDHGNKRYFESYFDTYPGVWKHGDWIKFDEKGSCIIYGRSDSTINRSGVRTGTSDIYRVVEGIEEVMESIAIDMEVLDRQSCLMLFVVLKDDTKLDQELVAKIKQQVRMNVSPRFIPDEVHQVEQIPKTLNGKKMEVPIRKLLLGLDMDKVINVDSVSNPESLPYFKELAARLQMENKGKLF
ncbi:acetoacetate--CoA ligase [Desertibacillus haloalkaliphilus]|uniref:acetoacetate--CoA ligase n=1 Tax=Desertibacillus haloalkaliphilus TaxID=1328930 RepID=UPI001C257190|nr:acetoacetate--CoA ligase [Desertibacillus haloalkaliphilus]MBU8906160.1 acetoacetate--CoA ligase [Desertibacillus haloalkaliphilus]